MDDSAWAGLEPPPGSVVVEDEPNGPVMHMRGEIDAPVMQRWESSRTVSEPAIVAVDVNAVTYIDSTGLTFLVRWAKARSEDGRPAVLRGTSNRFDQMLDMIGVSYLFVRER